MGNKKLLFDSHNGHFENNMYAIFSRIRTVQKITCHNISIKMFLLNF